VISRSEINISHDCLWACGAPPLFGFADFRRGGDRRLTHPASVANVGSAE